MQKQPLASKTVRPGRACPTIRQRCRIVGQAEEKAPTLVGIAQILIFITSNPNDDKDED